MKKELYINRGMLGKTYEMLTIEELRERAGETHVWFKNDAQTCIDAILMQTPQASNVAYGDLWAQHEAQVDVSEAKLAEAKRFAERQLIELAGKKLQSQGCFPDEYVGLTVNDAYEVLGIEERL